MSDDPLPRPGRIDPAEAAGHTNYRALAARLGEEVLQQRILKQAGLWARDVHQGVGVFKLEALIPMDRTIALALRLAGLSGFGLRNYLDVSLVSNEVCLPGLPEAFDGFRLLQLADLHCDLEPALIDRVIQCLDGVKYDAVALTGDYHNKIAGDHTRSLELMGRLCAHLHGPRLAILGNHDFIEQVAYLEAEGLTVLLNENVPLTRGGSTIWMCGVDDPHFFQTDDLEKSRRGVPSEGFAILLSHSPEPYRQAAALGFRFMLSGHTHGGQFCLPGGIPIIRNTRVPRRILAGPWREGALQGYTSRGTGGCGVAARFFCPPEITLHILRRAAKPGTVGP